ncbi:MAG TPA: Clp protease N-terminal domain-containing protein [Actinomycetota bacterium]|nr:Clp protease N-terminal domain-containing protein [Actinomycetota bacterium]
MSTSGELKSSPRYDRIVATSRQIAWDLAHSYVGVEHLFLAIVDDPDAVPTQVLSRFVDPAQVGAAVRDLITSDDWGSRRSDLP